MVDGPWLKLVSVCVSLLKLNFSDWTKGFEFNKKGESILKEDFHSKSFCRLGLGG